MFANQITNAKIKTREIYSLHSSMNNYKFVPSMKSKYNTEPSVNAKLSNLEDFCHCS